MKKNKSVIICLTCGYLLFSLTGCGTSNRGAGQSVSGQAIIQQTPKPAEDLSTLGSYEIASRVSSYIQDVMDETSLIKNDSRIKTSNDKKMTRKENVIVYPYIYEGTFSAYYDIGVCFENNHNDFWGPWSDEEVSWFKYTGNGQSVKFKGSVFANSYGGNSIEYSANATLMNIGTNNDDKLEVDRTKYFDKLKTIFNGTGNIKLTIKYKNHGIYTQKLTKYQKKQYESIITIGDEILSYCVNAD